MGLVLFSHRLEPLVINFWSSSITQLLALILAVFWLWDMLWHWSVRKTMIQRIERTKNNLKGPTKRYVELEQLSLLEHFLYGQWRVYRQIFGVIVIFIILYAVFFLDGISIPMVGFTSSTDSFASVTVFFFVIISEAWIGLKRLQMVVGVTSLEKMGKEYTLHKKAA